MRAEPVVYEEKCRELGIDASRVRSIANRITKAVKEAQSMGLIVFGGAGTGDLRKVGGSQNIVAMLGNGFEGGDGGDEY